MRSQARELRRYLPVHLFLQVSGCVLAAHQEVMEMVPKVEAEGLVESV
jgi:hypothetical protein